MTYNVQVTTASRVRPRHVATAEKVDAIEIADVAGSIDNPVHIGFCFWWKWMEEAKYVEITWNRMERSYM